MNRIIQVGRFSAFKQDAIVDPRGICPTLRAEGTGVGTSVVEFDETTRIRRLTPKECFRLQSFTDEDYEKAAFVNSDNQLYKQMGNSVTCVVIYEIAKRMGYTEEDENDGKI